MDGQIKKLGFHNLYSVRDIFSYLCLTEQRETKACALCPKKTHQKPTSPCAAYKQGPRCSPTQLSAQPRKQNILPGL